MVKRVIFDLDNTLLIPNYYEMSQYIQMNVKGIDKNFCDNVNQLLFEYEKKHKKYDKNMLLEYFNEKSNKKISMNTLNGIINTTANIPLQDFSESVEILKYLKMKKYKIVILTNWFKDIQQKKLKKAKIDQYIDDIFSGEEYLKPSKESFMNAIQNNKYSECAMVGDNFVTDIIEASRLGIKCFYLSKKTEYKEENVKYTKIYCLKELKKYL